MKVLLYRITKDRHKDEHGMYDRQDEYVACEGVVTNDDTDYVYPEYLEEDADIDDITLYPRSWGEPFWAFQCLPGYSMETKSIEINWDDYSSDGNFISPTTCNGEEE